MPSRAEDVSPPRPGTHLPALFTQRAAGFRAAAVAVSSARTDAPGHAPSPARGRIGAVVVAIAASATGALSGYALPSLFAPHDAPQRYAAECRVELPPAAGDVDLTAKARELRVEIVPAGSGVVAVRADGPDAAAAVRAANDAAGQLARAANAAAAAARARTLRAKIADARAAIRQHPASASAAAADLAALVRRQVDLASRLDRTRRLTAQADEEEADAAARERRLADGPDGETLADLEAERGRRLRAATADDELLRAAIAERTASAKDYWAEMGTGKTDAHRDVVLARRALDTAEAAVRTREAELARRVDQDMAAARDVAVRRAADEARLRVEAAHRLAAGYADRLDATAGELAAVEREVADAELSNQALAALQSEARSLQSALDDESVRPAGDARGPARVVQAASEAAASAGPSPDTSSWWNHRPTWAAGGLLVGLGASLGVRVVVAGGAAAAGARRGRRDGRARETVVTHGAIALPRAFVSAPLRHEPPRPPVDLPVLATLPDLASAGLPAAVGRRQLDDAFRRLRTSLLSSDDPCRTFAVVSPMAGQGTSSVLAGLAVALAAAGRHVLMVDANLYHPSLDERFGTPRSPGLCSLIEGEADASAAACVHRTEAPLIDLMPAGRPSRPPAELLGWPDLGRLLRTLGARYDAVLVDCPPLLNHPEARSLAASADRAVCVVGATPVDWNDVFHRPDDPLARRMAGLVLNRHPAPRNEPAVRRLS